MTSAINIDKRQYEYYEELLIDYDFSQEEIENLKFEELTEFEYEGNFEVKIQEEGGYNSWTGENEYDVFIILKCLEFKKIRYLTDLTPTNSFFVSGNKDGDYLGLKYLAVQKKIMLEIGHCCVVKKGIIVDVTTLTKILFDFFDERGNSAL